MAKGQNHSATAPFAIVHRYAAQLRRASGGKRLGGEDQCGSSRGGSPTEGFMKTIEQKFKGWDGVDLFYRAWLPEKPTNKALILFHRGHEHSGRWEETVSALDLPDIAVFAWDARG